jgi:hypothetical protein
MSGVNFSTQCSVSVTMSSNMAAAAGEPSSRARVTYLYSSTIVGCTDGRKLGLATLPSTSSSSLIFTTRSST